MDNVILTPHIGGSTEEAQANIGIDAASKLISYLDTGSTVNSHSIPSLHLPRQQGTHRILHIHKNESGVMTAINRTLSELNVNLTGQYLKTNEDVGYVVLDVKQSQSVSDQLLSKLQNIKHTIKARILY